MFALCCKCATEFSNTTCEHQDQDRIINGTWVTLEANLGNIAKNADNFEYSTVITTQYQFIISKTLKKKPE